MIHFKVYVIFDMQMSLAPNVGREKSIREFESGSEEKKEVDSLKRRKSQFVFPLTHLLSVCLFLFPLSSRMQFPGNIGNVGQDTSGNGHYKTNELVWKKICSKIAKVAMFF